jgi:arylsulfatase A-like enzyme
MSLYGYARPTTPRLDGFAAAAAVFEGAVAQSSWTRPSTAAIHTGRNPPGHGALTLRDSIRPHVPTLAELLRAAGYRTGAIVTNVNVAGQWGFGRGFDSYRYLPEDEHSSHVHVRADAVTDSALEWLAAGDRSQPFLLYLHVTDPHAPYDPPPPYAARFGAREGHAPDPPPGELLAALKRAGRRPTAAELGALVDRYDGEIAFVDAQFGRLLDELARLGVADRTLVVVTADHGEEFGEHGGLEHGRTLYQDQLHVPLMIRVPGRGGGQRIGARARQVDILPSVAAAVGVRAPADIEGRSLLPLLGGEAPGVPVEAMAQTSLGRRQLAALLVGDWKVIESKEIGKSATEVYSLSQDPSERSDRAEERPVLIGYVRQALAQAEAAPLVAGARPVPSPHVDPAVLERLRALGYSE